MVFGFHHETKGHPSELSHGETPGTAIPATGGGKRRTGATAFAVARSTGERAVPRTPRRILAI